MSINNIDKRTVSELLKQHSEELKKGSVEIGDIIRKARKENGLTQKQLGDILGVAHTAISKYEKGDITNIPIDTVLKLSMVLGINPMGLVNDNYSHLYSASHGFFKMVKDVLDSPIAIFDDRYLVIDTYLDNGAPENMEQLEFFSNLIRYKKLSQSEFQQIKTFIDFILSQRTQKNTESTDKKPE